MTIYNYTSHYCTIPQLKKDFKYNYTFTINNKKVSYSFIIVEFIKFIF